MPAKSEAQRRLLYAKFGKAWVDAHHFDNPGPLPEHVGKKKAVTKKKKAPAHMMPPKRMPKKPMMKGKGHG